MPTERPLTSSSSDEEVWRRRRAQGHPRRPRRDGCRGRNRRRMGRGSLLRGVLGSRDPDCARRRPGLAAGRSDRGPPRPAGAGCTRWHGHPGPCTPAGLVPPAPQPAHPEDDCWMRVDGTCGRVGHPTPRSDCRRNR